MAGELGKVHLPTKQLEETLSKLTVPELQQKLKKRGLKKSGVKAKLIQRLAEVCFCYYSRCDIRPVDLRSFNWFSSNISTS